MIININNELEKIPDDLVPIATLDVNNWNNVTTENMNDVISETLEKIHTITYKNSDKITSNSDVRVFIQDGHPVVTYRIVHELKQLDYIPVALSQEEEWMDY